MNNERLLLDTVFVQALLNQRDQYHDKAKTFLPRVRDAAEVWITEAILVEIGNALSAFICSSRISRVDAGRLMGLLDLLAISQKGKALKSPRNAYNTETNAVVLDIRCKPEAEGGAAAISSVIPSPSTQHAIRSQ
jgi:hypothetical protein